MNGSFAELADAYFDGSLDEAQAERLLGYLRESPAAATHLRALAAVDAGLRGLAGQRAAPAAIRRGVLARLAATGRSRDFRAAVERQLAVAAPVRRRRAMRGRRPGWATGVRALAAALETMA